MNKKHNNIVNGGALGGSILLGLALFAVVAFKILVINNMWGGYNLQKLKNENAYIYIEVFNFPFKYEKKNIIFREFYDELDNFYYIGIYQKKENDVIFLKKFHTYRYFLQRLRFESLESCRAYCEMTSELLNNDIIKAL